MTEQHRFLRGMVSWVGFKQTGVTYKRQPRYAGETKFTLKKMLRFALDAITGFSYLPLQLASYLGFVITLVSGLAILAVIALRLFGATPPLVGQATTLVAVLFLGGVQLICMGIIGEYLGRMYDEVKRRRCISWSSAGASKTLRRSSATTRRLPHKHSAAGGNRKQV